MFPNMVFLMMPDPESLLVTWKEPIGGGRILDPAVPVPRDRFGLWQQHPNGRGNQVASRCLLLVQAS